MDDPEKYKTSSFVYHFISIGKLKLQLQSGIAQFGSKSTIFLSRVTLKFDGWPWKTTGHPFYSTSQKILPSWRQALPGAKRRRQALPASAAWRHSSHPSVRYWYAIYTGRHELKGATYRCRCVVTWDESPSNIRQGGKVIVLLITSLIVYGSLTPYSM